MKNRPLTKDDKLAVIQRGMARLPAMGEEAKWAFGGPVRPDFVVPPPWVRRVVLLSFGVDPDAPNTAEPADLLKISKMLGSMVGLAEGAEIVLRPNPAAPTSSSGVLDEEKLKSRIAAAASPHLAKFAEQSGAVRQAFGQQSADQYAAFTAGQSEAAQGIAAEGKEPGSTSDMTHDLLTFLWTYWPEIPFTGSTKALHKWITDLGYIHCGHDLVRKVCGKVHLRLSKRGAKPRIATE
jgi:hypothetical protein